MSKREFEFRHHPEDQELWPYHLTCGADQPAEYIVEDETEALKDGDAWVAQQREEGYQLLCPKCKKKYSVWFIGESVMVAEVPA